MAYLGRSLTAGARSVGVAVTAVALVAVGLGAVPAHAAPPTTHNNIWIGETQHHVVVTSARPNEQNYDATSGYLDDLKTGFLPLAGEFRSYVELDLSGVRGTAVRSAILRARVNWSFCGGGATGLWLTGAIGPDTTWNNQPERIRRVGTTSVSNNATFCPGDGAVEFDVTEAVADAVAAGKQKITFMFAAADRYDFTAWREFDLNPTLRIKYNSYPEAPTQLGMERGLYGCTQGNDRVAIGTRTPRLQAKVVDPDGGTLAKVGFRLYSGPVGSGELVGEYFAYHVPSGSFATVRVPDGAITSDSVYHWSVWSSDGELRSATVGNCEFVVDTVDPAAPVVSSPDYPEGVPAGGIGKTGTFTLRANGSSDVVSYKYWFTGGERHFVKPEQPGGSVTIEWNPTMAGPLTLFVHSFDRAGNPSPVTRYRVFVMAHDPLRYNLVGRWQFDGGLADTSGNGRALRAHGGARPDATGYAGSAGSLDGGNDWFATSGAVLDTSASFSVSAWVKPSELGSSATVLSQDGEVTSGFRLGVTAAGAWTFTMADADTQGDQRSRVVSERSAEAGVWTHLVGVYDSAAEEIRLYVNGTPAGTVEHTADWNAQGPLVIGAGKSAGARSAFFAGAVDDVRVYQRALLPRAVALLANKSVERAHYELDEGSGDTTVDSITGAEATLHGAASWSVRRYTSVRLAPTADTPAYLSGERPRIRTDRSYTVAAWVRADALGDTDRHVLSLGHSGYSPFTLGYDAESGEWAFTVSCSATTECTKSALSGGQARTGEWVHLTGVYDAVHNEARLYVNGRFAGKVSGVTSYNSAGDLLIGRSVRSGAPAGQWSGLVDGVQVFTGVLSELEIGQLAIHF